jgi:co-chaperonin GroES (HSP10)
MSLLDTESLADVAAPDSEKAKQVPEPRGWRILVMMPEVKEKTDTGIFIDEEYREKEGTASPVAFVVKLGPLAYKDEARFPDGPWCEEGDFVIMRPYSGTRMMIHGREFRIIKDDTVEAVVDDPRGVIRR